MNVEELAESQYGLITRAQALEHMSASAVERRVRSARWVRMFPGVYRVSGAPMTGRQHALATTMWAGDGALISHLTGARLLRLEAMPHPEWRDVTIDRRTSLSAPGIVVHRSALTRLDRVVVDRIPCTSATRTLVDCAALVDGETLETAVERARQMGLTSIPALRKNLGRGRPGSALIRDVLAHAEARPRESRLEVKFARLLRRSGLPQPAPQFEIAGYRVDYAWPWLRVVCECDGFEWHGNRLQWKRDRRRIAAIEAAHWLVVHVTWDDVTERPAETLDRVAFALRAAA